MKQIPYTNEHFVSAYKAAMGKSPPIASANPERGLMDVFGKGVHKDHLTETRIVVLHESELLHLVNNFNGVSSFLRSTESLGMILGVLTASLKEWSQYDLKANR